MSQQNNEVGIRYMIKGRSVRTQPSFVNVIGDTVTEAFEKAAQELGNQMTVDKLKLLGYYPVRVKIYLYEEDESES